MLPIDSSSEMRYMYGMIRGKLTTAEAAKKAGIHQVTLQRWIRAGRVKAPKPTLIGGVGYRLWSADDIAVLRRLKGTLKPGPKKRA
jgi:excisionase family DNA binding protein